MWRSKLKNYVSFNKTVNIDILVENRHSNQRAIRVTRMDMNQASLIRMNMNQASLIGSDGEREGGAMISEKLVGSAPSAKINKQQNTRRIMSHIARQCAGGGGGGGGGGGAGFLLASCPTIRGTIWRHKSVSWNQWKFE